MSAPGGTGADVGAAAGRQAAACPACRSRSVHPVAAEVRRGGAAVPATPFRLLSCAACGLWFKAERPAREELERYYAELPVDSSAWNYSARLPHERRLDDLLRGLPTGSRVLDVGCWTGRLLSPHRERLRLLGVEPNPRAADVARESGLTMIGREVDDVARHPGTFDLIVLVDVFEHLLEPVAALRVLIDRLAEGGRLLVVTGRTDCFPVRVVRHGYWYFACSDHLVFLNRRFVRWLAGEVGCAARYRPIRHFDFRARQAAVELVWLGCWRFLSPHSPFPNGWMQRLPGTGRFRRLREPMVCGMWRDHALVELRPLGEERDRGTADPAVATPEPVAEAR